VGIVYSETIDSKEMIVANETLQQIRKETKVTLDTVYFVTWSQ